jgi:hypothetical protein
MREPDKTNASAGSISFNVSPQDLQYNKGIAETELVSRLIAIVPSFCPSGGCLY